MQRVAVIGCGGSGKSTFADALGRGLGVDVLHVDAFYWQPGWVPTAREPWRRVQHELVAGDRWIIDGNYSATLDIRLARADTVVFFDMPRRSCLRGVLRRWARHRGQPLQARGCPERWNWGFLLWVYRYPRHSRPRVLAAIARHAQHARLIVIHNRQEAAAVLADATRGAISARVR